MHGVNYTDVETSCTLRSTLHVRPYQKYYISAKRSSTSVKPVVSTEGEYRHFKVEKRGRLTLANIVFTGGYTDSCGGSLYNAGGTVVLRNVMFKMNRASYGGAVCSRCGYLVSNDTSYFLNVATQGAGFGN